MVRIHIVTVHTSCDINRSLHAVCRLVEKLSNVDDIAIINQGQLTFNTRLQALFKLQFASRLECIIHQLILTHALQAERLGPGAFDKTVQTVTRCINTGMIGNHQSELETSLDEISKHGVLYPKKDDVDWLIETYASGVQRHIRKALRTSLNLVGFAGRISVERAARENMSIELKKGYTFNVSPGFDVVERFDKPHVIVIDGFVESVGEINSLLEECAVAKTPVLLFVRGLADDVLSTLKVNYDRGTLRVVPIVVRFDFEGINTLVDVAIACAADLKSTAKGDLISTATLAESPVVESASVFKTQIVITNSSTTNVVNNHVVDLRKRRLECIDDSVAKLFDKRIHSLSPNQAIIRLINDASYVKNSQAIDYTLRAFKSLLEHGSIKRGDDNVLASTYVASRLHAMRCITELNNIGAVVIT